MTETQSQQDQLYSRLSNMGEEGRTRRYAIAVFDVMASLAVMPIGTPSLLDTDEDDDTSRVCHVAKAQKRDGDERKPDSKNQ